MIAKKSAKSVPDLENTRVAGWLQGSGWPIDVAFASWPSPERPGLVDGSDSRGDDAICGAFAAVRSAAVGDRNRQRLGAVVFRYNDARDDRRYRWSLFRILRDEHVAGCLHVRWG